MTDKEIKSRMIAYEIIKTTTQPNNRLVTYDDVQVDYDRIAQVRKVRESVDR